MSQADGTEPLTREELAWELASLFNELTVDRINEVLAKNVPMETLEFIAAYSDDFADEHAVPDETRRVLPNLVLLGYLMRVVEDRLIDDDPGV